MVLLPRARAHEGALGTRTPQGCGRGREAPITQQEGGVREPALGPPVVCPLPPGNHFFRAPASPASPVPGASPPSEAIMGPVLSTWSPSHPLRPRSGACPLRSLVAPPAQPTLRFSGDLPAPLHLCSPEAWLGWTRAAGLQGAGLELSPRPLEPLVSTVATYPMLPPLAGLPDQTRSLLRSHQFPDPGLWTCHQAPFCTHVLLHLVQRCLVRVHREAPLPGARHSARSHILRT